MLKSAVFGSSFGSFAGAAGELLGRPDGARAGSVDVEVRLVLRVRHQRVGMRSPAGLHGGHLFRLAHVADVEDADAAEALGADRLLNALRSAVEPAPRLFHRHDQQVAVDRHVSLAARAHHGGDEPGLPRILDVVGIEPVKAAEEEMVPLEREVREREAEGVRPLRRLIRGRRLRMRARVFHLGLGRHRAGALGSRGLAAGRLRIEEPLGLGEIRRRAPCCARPCRRPESPP